ARRASPGAVTLALDGLPGRSAGEIAGGPIHPLGGLPEILAPVSGLTGGLGTVRGLTRRRRRLRRRICRTGLSTLSGLARLVCGFSARSAGGGGLGRRARARPGPRTALARWRTGRAGTARACRRTSAGT